MQNSRFRGDQSRRDGYNAEREFRWTLETKLRLPVMDLLCQRLDAQTGKRYKYAPYADELISTFAQSYPGSPIPYDIRGAPDFKLFVEDQVYYVELKIKTTRFKNTVHGNGRDIPAYGCESNYLDSEPVYVNTLLHTTQNNLPLKDIWFLYALNPQASTNMPIPFPLSDNGWDLECINLQTLASQIGSGAYSLFGKGYGKTVYLVRCDDMVAPEHAFI